jgi:metallo-beta-lactamase class B
MEQTSGITGGRRRRSGAFIAIWAVILVVAAGTGGVALLPERTAIPVASTSLDGRSTPKPDRIAAFLARAPVRIGESVYLLGDMRPSAVYVVKTSNGLVMIDTGLESAHGKLLAGMSKLGLDVRRLKLILLTHVHGDHSMGAQRLRDETGAKIYIGREDAATLRRGGPWESVFSKFDMKGETLHPTTVDGELTDGQVLELGEARFRVIATPGHTPGSCCYLLELNGQRALFTGDTLQAFTVNTGTYAARLPPRYGGDVDRYLRSLGALRRLATPDLVLPGHPSSDGAPNPKLTDDAWKALVDRGLVELDKWHERYERDGADFLDGHPKEILDGLYYLGDFEGRAAYALVSQKRALLFDGTRGDDAVRRLADAWEAVGAAAPAIAAVALTSCEPENLRGLRSLIEAAGCHVVAPDDGLEAVARACPEGTAVVSPAELSALGWGEVLTLPIAGLGEPQAVYAFRHQETTVLVSGDLPVDLDAPGIDELSRRGPPQGWDAELLTSSLKRLADIRPDIWLSACPSGGRNANLYDRSWANTLTSNHQLVRAWSSPSR